jgi:GT2 family glycosyltransferase
MKVYASALALLASRYSMNFLYFISLSMITRIELYSTPVNRSLEGGSLMMKSNAIDFYAPFSTGVNLSCL